MRVNLAEERLNRGLSVAQMAERANVSASVLQRAEAGKSIHPKNAHAIASYLDYRVTDIWPVVEVAA